MAIFLYHKHCNHCGLNYFGKTTKDNPYTYYGSGKYWLRHINKHGKNPVVTLNVWKFEYQSFATAFALKFSHENNIVESDEWANLREENAIDGGSDKGTRPKSKAWCLNQSLIMTGKIRTEETCEKISRAKLGKLRGPRKLESIEKQKESRRKNNLKQTPESNLLRSKSLKGKNTGKIPWNKGLTIETDERVAIYAKNISITKNN